MNALALGLVMIAVAGAESPAQLRDTVRVDIARGSRVWIEGSSNVADWRCQAVAFDARVDLEPSGLRSINVKVAVRDLKCGNGKMEHDLYAALKATDPSNPAYIVGRFDVVHDTSAAGLTTAGPLTVAGVERTVTVPVMTDRLADGALRARGAVTMRMTDFGIKPPVGLFGLIRSRNEVTVKFDLAVPTGAVVGLR